MTLVRLGAPAQEEPLGGGLPFGHASVRHPFLIAARRLRHQGEHGGREAGEVVPCLLVRDVDQLAEPPISPEVGSRRLQVGHDPARADGQRNILGPGHARLEAVVDQEAPDLLVRHLPHELLDVDAAVAESAALLVGLRDLRLEGDDAFEPRLEVVAHPSLSISTRTVPHTLRRAPPHRIDYRPCLTASRSSPGTGRGRRSLRRPAACWRRAAPSSSGTSSRPAPTSWSSTGETRSRTTCSSRSSGTVSRSRARSRRPSGSAFAPSTSHCGRASTSTDRCGLASRTPVSARATKASISSSSARTPKTFTRGSSSRRAPRRR